MQEKPAKLDREPSVQEVETKSDQLLIDYENAHSDLREALDAHMLAIKAGNEEAKNLAFEAILEYSSKVDSLASKLNR